MKSNRAFKSAITAFLLTITLVPTVQAQTPAATFEELRTRLKLAEKESIEITETNGSQYKARISALSDGKITIMRNGVSRELAESDVLQIRHTRRDGVGNGALIGLASGVGAATVGVYSVCGANDGECGAIASAVFYPTFAGAGVGIGILVDALMKKHETVFAGVGVGTNRSLRIAPVIGKKTAGVSVSFGF